MVRIGVTIQTAVAAFLPLVVADVGVAVAATGLTRRELPVGRRWRHPFLLRSLRNGLGCRGLARRCVLGAVSPVAAAGEAAGSCTMDGRSGSASCAGAA